MHRSEEESWSSCVACGADVVPTVDRCFRFGESGVLCYACSIERGGSYDEGRDVWRSAPRVEDVRRLGD